MESIEDNIKKLEDTIQKAKVDAVKKSGIVEKMKILLPLKERPGYISWERLRLSFGTTLESDYGYWIGYRIDSLFGVLLVIDLDKDLNVRYVSRCAIDKLDKMNALLDRAIAKQNVSNEKHKKRKQIELQRKLDRLKNEAARCNDYRYGL